MGKKRLPPGFVYDRPVPSRWAEMLAELAPKNDLRPWLLLAWMSGDPWEQQEGPEGIQYGVQRWCVYEMIPLRVWWGLIQAQRQKGHKEEDIIQWQILDALNGPHPRDLGHFDEVLDRFVSDAEVTRQEWELYREHKAIPLLFWIIQGENGGHKRTFTPIEQKYLKLAGLPSEAPAPGSLPYADFDQRALFQLARRDRIHTMQTRLSPMESERSQQAVELRRQVVAYLGDQVRATLESARLDINDLPKSSDPKYDPTPKLEEATERFINTGSTEPPLEE